MSIPVQQGPGIQIQNVTVAQTGQVPHRPAMQTVERSAGGFIKIIEKRLKVNWLAIASISKTSAGAGSLSRYRHPRQFVGTANNAPHHPCLP